jgi:hypothetical protein
MAGSLDGRSRRVRRLEDGRGAPCGECGFGVGPLEYEVLWYDHDEPAEPKWCGACGRQYEFVVTWGDIPDHRDDVV